MERLAGRRVIVAGLFSAKVPDAEARLGVLAEHVRAHSGTVVGQVLQRRGVSRSRHPGGVRRMDPPLSQKTLLGSGKARELAALCLSAEATLVLFWNPLTPPQRATLEALTGVDVRDAASLGLGLG
jgi:GTP-binding protein HflX